MREILTEEIKENSKEEAALPLDLRNSSKRLSNYYSFQHDLGENPSGVPSKDGYFVLIFRTFNEHT